MKWQTLTLSLFASGALSSPIAALSKNDIYTLRVSSYASLPFFPLPPLHLLVLLPPSPQY